jgi:RNA polymerase sigma-70 factor (ECF subfamily)
MEKHEVTQIHPAPASLVRRLFEQAGAARWALPEPDFHAALDRSVAHRFRGQSPTRQEVVQYLESLHVEDLGLACACARGSQNAWEHFVRTFRPTLLRAAAVSAPPDTAREIADAIYADLYGLDEREGRRRSLFEYFHGRSALAGWLRAVLAQRVVDRSRAVRRLDPLPEEDGPGAFAARDAGPPDLDQPRYLALVRAALSAALAGLEPRDRLRLALYYTQDLTLAAIGRVLGESEATASRKLERTRRGLRAEIERRLREEDRLTDAQVTACFEYGRSDPAFDLARALPPDG